MIQVTECVHQDCMRRYVHVPNPEQEKEEGSKYQSVSYEPRTKERCKTINGQKLKLLSYPRRLAQPAGLVRSDSHYQNCLIICPNLKLIDVLAMDAAVWSWTEQKCSRLGVWSMAADSWQFYVDHSKSFLLLQAGLLTVPTGCTCERGEIAIAGGPPVL